ncbi:hypothetical protein [uncultured Winogradskyella sp.]|uniref:hypothetical protein n=1 Tax=uncultured Winogradskyella sp. TaxID=395353 RepID=UPI002616E08C|nr:hypothetical protein [uncultured Winogradskyella sp.]
MKFHLSIIVFVMLTYSGYSQDESAQSKHYVLGEFAPGYILMKDGSKQTGVLNYNALANNFALKKDDEVLGLSSTIITKIDTVYVADKKFFRKDDKFYELLLKSDIELYVEYNCNLSTSTEGRNGYGSSSQTSSSKALTAIINQGNLYNIELPKLYKVTLDIEYLIKKDDTLTRIKTVNQFKKVYTDYKKEIKKYRKEHKVKVESPLTVKKFVEYLEGL